MFLILASNEKAKASKISKTSSQDVKHSSSTKLKKGSRRSSDGIRSENIGEEESLTELELPDEVPTQEVAYKYFKRDRKYCYKELSENLIRVEGECRELQRDYLKEVKKLQEMLVNYEKKRDNLLNVKFFSF